jgi:hypothetical protein
MTNIHFGRWVRVALVMALVIPATTYAQRDIHWQINPKGFPSNTSVFVDVEEQSVFKRDLTAAAFAVSMDEYAGDQGGWIINQQQVVAGQAGAQVLIIVDISSSYTSEFSNAKQALKSFIGYMDGARDQVAIATAPATGGFQEAKLDVPFTNDQSVLLAGVNNLKTLGSKDRSGARLCNALSEGLRFFPEKSTDKYRAVIIITGGADKGEGKGDCVKDSYMNGLVPFFPIVYKLDKKYDDPRNAHKIENSTHDLAQNTGGRSIFRKGDNSNKQFVGMIWNRIRSQYQLLVTFPCFQPMPTTEHYSLLKVEGRDAEPIKFQATSAPAPTPTITALYPPFANSKDIEDGKVDLTIDGTGFCGPPGAVRVAIGGVQAQVKEHNPFRAVVTLNAGHKTGTVSVANRFGETGESPMKFTVNKPPKGAATITTLTFMVIGILVFAVLAIVIVALKSRKAKPKTVDKSLLAPPRKSDLPSKESASAKTMAMTTINSAWAELSDGTKVTLDEGDNLIGREETCKIQITIGGASREHARIDFDKSHGLIWAEDLGSTNGTFYGKGNVAEKDASKLEKRQLISSGDAIWVASQKIIIRFDGGVKGEG